MSTTERGPVCVFSFSEPHHSEAGGVVEAVLIGLTPGGVFGQLVMALSQWPRFLTQGRQCCLEILDLSALFRAQLGERVGTARFPDLSNAI